MENVLSQRDTKRIRIKLIKLFRFWQIEVFLCVRDCLCEFYLFFLWTV